MSVAVGRDSVVVGEDQILHQLRASVDAARAAGTLDPALERLFALALQAGRRARSWRQGPARSLADVALASIEQQAGAIRGRDVLVVGAGKMGRLAARAAVAAGASVAVANRSADGAAALAASTGARIEAFDPGARIGRLRRHRRGARRTVADRGRHDRCTGRERDRRGRSLGAGGRPRRARRRFSAARLITADALALADIGPSAQDGSAARLDALVERSTAEFVPGSRDARGGRPPRP